jgi:hypothetical protein
LIIEDGGVGEDGGENAVLEKSFDFAVRMVELSKHS